MLSHLAAAALALGASLSSALPTAEPLSSALPAGELFVVPPTGPILGHYAGGDNTVREFLGIRYGKAPTGDRRFAVAQRATPWLLPYHATSFGASCYTGYTPGGITAFPPSSMSEDCLFVNVWTPRKSRLPSGGATVMLYVYGGGWTLGSTEDPRFNGANIVRDQDDVIVVSMNYRLGALGYPGSPGLPTGKLNPGLLDLREAVKWVRDNIRAFGGNPDKITLFGQSAGAGTIDAYLYYAKDDPLIEGAIISSGSVRFILDNRLGNPTPGVNWDALATAVGCPTTPAATSLTCMRALPVATLHTAQFTNSLLFSPVIDEGTIFSDTTTRLANGDFARVPVLVGSNDEEIPGAAAPTKAIFTCPAAQQAQGHAPYVPTWDYRYFGSFPEGPGLPNLGPTHGSETMMIFGTYDVASATPEQVAVSSFVQNAWTAFAKNPATGLVGFGAWPTFDPSADTLVRIAVGNAALADFVDPDLYQAGC